MSWHAWNPFLVLLGTRTWEAPEHRRQHPLDLDMGRLMVPPRPRCSSGADPQGWLTSLVRFPSGVRGVEMPGSELPEIRA